MNHDVIVIGASAGGVEVLLGLVRELPANLPAAIFITVHTAPEFMGALPELLSQRGRLPACYPVHNQGIAHGNIYVAPADNQLILRSGYLEVVRGPRENGHRPAVDALFRSASWAYGPRVVGVVLSGYQDCGTAGLMSIKARGGVTVAQLPESALAPEMPRSAIDRVEIDHVVHPVELPGLLVRLAAQEAGPAPTEVSQAIRQLEGQEPGRRAELACPTCQGVLTEAQAGDFEHFRCHVGHAFSLRNLAKEQGEEMERALWAAVRSLEEGAALSKRLAGSDRDTTLRGRFAEKSATLLRHADLIRAALLNSGVPAMPKPSESSTGS